MKKQFDFLKEKSAILIGTVLVLVLFRFSFYLGDLDPEFFSVPAEITIFLLGVYLIFSYGFYKKERTEREENNRLREEHEVLKMEMISKNKELQDYFMLWVHQIKTPITVSKLMIESKNAEAESEKIKLQLLYIEQYTDMAINYLKLMRADTDMDVTAVRLEDVVKAVLKKYSFLFFRKRLALKLGDLKETVISDTKWLSVLIEQILSNALKYTETGFIRIYTDRGKSALVIEDSGIGIRSEDIPKIFDKGYSGFNGRLNQKSSGLGLFLAKKIGERLGMEIQVQSVLGSGSSFFLKFPELLEERKE